MCADVNFCYEFKKNAFFSLTEAGGSQAAPMFFTTSYLMTEESEIEFLRKLCEVMIIFLLPRGYSLAPLKNLLSEILAFKSKKDLFRTKL